MPSYYFRSTGSTAWNLASNWSLTDGGLATGAVPTNADDAFFSNNSGNCVLNAASLVCKTLDFTKGTGYANTFTITNPITVSGNVTLSSLMTITGANALTVNATANLKSNGKTMTTGTLTISGAITVTMQDSWTVVNLSIGLSPTITLNADLYITGTYTAINTTGGATFSGAYIVYCPSFNLLSGSSYIAGSSGATVVINGTGTITTGSAGGANTGFRISTTINHSGTTTINGLSLQGGFPFVRTAGSVTITGTVYMQNGTCTMTGFSGITIPNLTISGAGVGCTAIFDFTTISGTLTTGIGPIIQDASGFSVGTLTSSTSGSSANITLTASHTYTINTAITINTTTSAGRVGFVSSIPGTKVILTLQQGATQDLSFVNFTDINASLGKTICTYKGTIVTSNNVRLLPTDVQTISY